MSEPSHDASGTASTRAAEQTAARESARAWAAANTFRQADFPAERLVELKRETTVSVVIPSRQVADTIGLVVAECVALRDAGAVDDVIVVDADSSDGSARIAADAGAEVHQESALVPELGSALGKGDAMWRALAVARGDIVVYVDSDSVGFDRDFVCGLTGPLLKNPELKLVKGAYRRPFSSGASSVPDGGGRVSELAARPLLNIFFPELSAVQQPLGGEIAGRRSALIDVGYFTGYGCEIQTLIDLYLRFGLTAIAQSDLGERINAHQPLHDLGSMAFAVSRAILSRVEGLDDSLGGDATFLNYVEGEARLRSAPLVERPPFATIASEVARVA
ncbi:MAG: glucosyl-3-phosphoglycerate synthase [Solirubrobacterales bacterium]